MLDIAADSEAGALGALGSLCSSSDETSRGYFDAPARPSALWVELARLLRMVRVLRVLGAQHPLLDGQQLGELVAGPAGSPACAGPAGEVVAGGQGFRVLGARHRRGSAAARRTGRGPSRIPRCPVQVARLARAVRVRGCSRAEHWIVDRQQRGEQVRAPAGSPLPGRAGEAGAHVKGPRVLRAEHPSWNGSSAEIWSRAAAASPSSRSRGKVGAGAEGVRVLGAEDSLADGQQGGELVLAAAGSAACPVKEARL